MIVCDSAPQARAVSEQLSRTAKYSHALVLHDEGTKQDRKDIQEDFKKVRLIFWLFTICCLPDLMHQD